MMMQMATIEDHASSDSSQQADDRLFRAIASTGFCLPTLVAVGVLLMLPEPTSLNRDFFLAAASVIPTLGVALALQIGTAFERLAPRLAFIRPSTTFPTRIDDRALYVVMPKGGPIGYPKPAGIAAGGIVIVYALMAAGEVSALTTLASNDPPTARSLLWAAAGASAGGAMILWLVVVDVCGRFAAIPTVEKKPDAAAEAAEIADVIFNVATSEVRRAISARRDAQRLRAARETQQRAVETLEAVHGAGHPEVASALVRLGVLEQQLGEVAVAQHAIQRALTIFDRSYGAAHPSTQHAREILASLLDVGQLVEQRQRLGLDVAARLLGGCRRPRPIGRRRPGIEPLANAHLARRER